MAQNDANSSDGSPSVASASVILERATRAAREDGSSRRSVMSTWVGRHAQRALLLTLLFIASRAVIWVYLAGRGTDLGRQKGYAEEIVSGRMPFRDFFPEYPPLVFLYTAIPAFVAPSPDWYFPIFRALTCAVDCALWLILLWRTVSPVARDGNADCAQEPAEVGESFGWSGGPVAYGVYPRATTAQLLLYIAGTTALGPLIYDRIDLVLGAILLAGVLAMYGGRERVFQLLMGLGIAFKLVPVVLIPMILAREWTKHGVSRAPCDEMDDAAQMVAASGGTHGVPYVMLRACLLLALPTLLSFGAVAALGGYGFDKLLRFHAERPVQIESGPAAIEMALTTFGLSTDVTFSYGGVNLESSLAGFLTASGSMLIGAACLASAILVLCRNVSTESFALLTGAVLSAAMVLSKVLSPQYFLFLLPVIVVLQVPRERAAAMVNWLLIVVIYIITGLIYPWFYGDLTALKPCAEFMVIIRDELLLVLAISLAWRAWRRSAPLSEAIMPSGVQPG
jgi:hypothetical protein